MRHVLSVWDADDGALGVSTDATGNSCMCGLLKRSLLQVGEGRRGLWDGVGGPAVFPEAAVLLKPNLNAVMLGATDHHTSLPFPKWMASSGGDYYHFLPDTPQASVRVCVHEYGCVCV